jgi:hypothetical protein
MRHRPRIRHQPSRPEFHQKPRRIATLPVVIAAAIRVVAHTIQHPLGLVSIEAASRAYTRVALMNTMPRHAGTQLDECPIDARLRTPRASSLSHRIPAPTAAPFRCLHHGRDAISAHPFDRSSEASTVFPSGATSDFANFSSAFRCFTIMRAADSLTSSDVAYRLGGDGAGVESPTGCEAAACSNFSAHSPMRLASDGFCSEHGPHSIARISSISGFTLARFRSAVCGWGGEDSRSVRGNSLAFFDVSADLSALTATSCTRGDSRRTASSSSAQA